MVYVYSKCTLTHISGKAIGGIVKRKIMCLEHGDHAGFPHT